MDGRELVRKTLEFQNTTGRVPIDIWAMPWAQIHQPEWVRRIQEDFAPDIVRCPVGHTVPAHLTGDPNSGEDFIDDWGVLFESVAPGAMGEVKHPIITGEDEWDVSRVRFPEERMLVDRDAVNRYCDGQSCFVMAEPWPRPFERLQFLRGTENLYMDLMLEPKGMKEFIRKVHDHYVRELEVWARTDVDGLRFMDDAGAQNSLLIHPDVWRHYFKPCYKDYIDIAHVSGKKAFMHSDGYILPIIPDLIGLGLDALNCQIFCMGIENLKPFAGKITFWGEMDRQHLLPEGRPQDIDRAVRDVHAALWKNGGCIAQCDFGLAAKGENVYQVYKTWQDLAEE